MPFSQSRPHRRTWFSRLTFIAFFLMVTCFAGSAAALTLKPYSAAAVKTAQTKGEAIALHFHADWCATCRAQQSAMRTMEANGGPAVTVFVVDYDKAKELRRKLKVRSQSTLIVYRGRKETGRLSGDTDPQKIGAALRTAVSP